MSAAPETAEATGTPCRWCNGVTWYTSNSGGFAQDRPCDYCNPTGKPRAARPANDKWWQVHIPGQRTHYGNWRIHYDPTPIPTRAFDWSYWHKDFDGAEDACDDRYGATSSLLAAMNAIDDLEDDLFDERGCEECPLGTPTSCLKAGPCNHRDDRELRRRLRELVERAR